MITKWRLFNFKSVRDRTELELGPLTVLAGANSSGKSTLIQSILLISQTLASRVSSRSVVLNGHLSKLGQFDDLRSFKSLTNQIHIGWECEPHSSPFQNVVDAEDTVGNFIWSYVVDTDFRSVACDISFDVETGGPQRDLEQLRPRLFSCNVACRVNTGDGAYPKSEFGVTRAEQAGIEQTHKILRLSVQEPKDESLRSSLGYDVALDEDSRQELREERPPTEPVGCVLRHFLPLQLTVRYNRTATEAIAVADTICEIPSRPTRRLPRYFRDREVIIPKGVVDVLRKKLGQVVEPMLGGGSLFGHEADPSATVNIADWRNRVQRLQPSQRLDLRRKIQAAPTLHDEICIAVRKGRPDDFALAYRHLPGDVSDAVDYLTYQFSEKVRYLGPLRDEPKPLYPLAATVDPVDIGLKGEHTAAVLDLHKIARVAYVPADRFLQSVVDPQPDIRSLGSAVLDWLRFLGVAEGIETRDSGKLGHELKVVSTQAFPAHDLTHVGVGVSQVLPILVVCLLAEADTTIIVEQPELHLHPRVQTLLADFFLSMSMLGKQCIIETHSEYLINRLRFRLAAADTGGLTPAVKLYFVENKSGASRFREVRINEYGAITDWPEGFFDQSQRESEEILKAAIVKRNKRQRAK